MSRQIPEAVPGARSTTWIVGGSLLIASAVPLLLLTLQAFFPGLGTLVQVLAPILLLLFPLALGVLAVGLIPADSVVGRLPLGVVALLVVALSRVVLDVSAPPAQMLMALVVVQAAAAVVTLVFIARAGILPRRTLIIGAIAAGTTALTFAVQLLWAFGGQAQPLLGVIVAAVFVQFLTQAALGVALILARRA